MPASKSALNRDEGALVESNPEGDRYDVDDDTTTFLRQVLNMSNTYKSAPVSRETSARRCWTCREIDHVLESGRSCQAVVRLAALVPTVVHTVTAASYSTINDPASTSRIIVESATGR